MKNAAPVKVVPKRAPLVVAKPGVLGGKPCIAGTRISVEFILELLASGATPDDVIKAYPQITRKGLGAALRYAAQAMRNEVVVDVDLAR